MMTNGIFENCIEMADFSSTRSDNGHFQPLRAVSNHYHFVRTTRWLGLSIPKRIIEIHQELIEIEPIQFQLFYDVFQQNLVVEQFVRPEIEVVAFKTLKNNIGTVHWY